MARGEARGRIRMIELAGIKPGMRVLDVACGPGNITRLIAQRAQPGGHAVGIDLASGMIELAIHHRPPGADFALMDMENLAFSDHVFDAVVCGHGLQFAPDLGRALREAARVLRPRGVLAASVPAPGPDDTVWDLIEATVDAYLPPRLEAVDETATRRTVADPSALQAAALAAGFQTAGVESVLEVSTWPSASELVSKFVDWWRCAARLDVVDAPLQAQMVEEATAAVQRAYPGTIVTRARNLVLASRKV